MRRGLCCGDVLFACGGGSSMCFGRITTAESALLGRLVLPLSKVAERLVGEGERATCRSPESELRWRNFDRPGLLMMAEERRGEGDGRGESIGDTREVPSSVTLEKNSLRPAPALIDVKISSVLGRWCGSTESKRLRYL
jgi:hypothetical protein